MNWGQGDPAYDGDVWNIASIKHKINKMIPINFIYIPQL